VSFQKGRCAGTYTPYYVTCFINGAATSANATKDLRLLLACFESLLVRLRKQPGLHSFGVPVRIVLNENQNRHFYLEYFLREFCTRTSQCERGQETSIRVWDTKENLRKALPKFCVGNPSNLNLLHTTSDWISKWRQSSAKVAWIRRREELSLRIHAPQHYGLKSKCSKVNIRESPPASLHAPVERLDLDLLDPPREWEKVLPRQEARSPSKRFTGLNHPVELSMIQATTSRCGKVREGRDPSTHH
jgi:hypothetical protein